VPGPSTAGTAAPTAAHDAYWRRPLWEITWGGFDPLLDLDELSLDKGERVAGWLVLDVPGRHGQLVLRNQWTHKLAVWTY
jgi:hypothetical protein